MEGLELFAGNSPAERALAAKLQSVEEELAGYKEEHRYAEARVSAHAHILRRLEGEPIPGMCGACYLKLKKRVRSLESEHLSPAALADYGPKEEPEHHAQGERLESPPRGGLKTGLESGLEKGRKGVETEGQQVAKPVRAARRLPRQVEGERVNEGLAALTWIQVAPLRREHSTTDSVAAVIDDPHLAATGFRSAGPSVAEEEVVSALGVQEESQGEVEGSGPSVTSGDSITPSAGKTKSGSVYNSAFVEGLSGDLPEDSGDCSVNGGLGGDGTPKLEKSESVGRGLTGQSPLRKGDRKTSPGVEDDVSSDEGSTARVEEKVLESGLAPERGVLSRVMNLSNKSMGSSASSIVSPEVQELEGRAESERDGSSEGAAESEWKDAQAGSEEDLSDDGDSRAPALSLSVKQTGESAGKGGVEKAESAEDSTGEGSEGVAVKEAALGGDAEEGSNAGGSSAGEGTGQLEEQSKGVRAVDSNEDSNDGDASNGAVAEVEESTEKPKTERAAELNPDDGALEEGLVGGGVADGEGHPVSNAPSQNKDERPLMQAQSSAVESGGDVDDINVDEVVVDESSIGEIGAGVVAEQDSAVDQSQGRLNGSGGPPPRVLRVRPRVSLNFTVFSALASAAKTTQEGQEFYEAKQERLERLRRQKAEQEAEVERVRQVAAAEERARQLAARDERARQLAVSAKPSMAERLKGRGAENPSGLGGADQNSIADATGSESQSGSYKAERPIENGGQGAETPSKTVDAEKPTGAEQPASSTGAGVEGGRPGPLPGSFLQAVAGGSGESASTAAATGPPRKLTAEERKAKMVSKKDFVYMERDRSTGRMVNILQGLELHKNVLSVDEQKKLVERIKQLQEQGQAGKLMPRTFTQPRKWMRGKGRVTIQFGCCYNYAVDKMGNPPGILRTEAVDPIPNMIQSVIKRLIDWGVMPKECVPDSCIVNIYDEGDCIPPHIDHHDFLRPFCTLSLLTEADIVFGTTLHAVAEGEFQGPVRIALPVGSVLILNGNGADVAKHCIPGVPAKRISITLRKMDPAKAPHHLTQTALHTPLPGPPLPPPPKNDRGSASDSWRRAPDNKPTEPRLENPAPGEKPGGAEEAWPELGGEKKRAAENIDVDKPDVSAGAAFILKGAWGRRQEANFEEAPVAIQGEKMGRTESDDVAEENDVAEGADVAEESAPPVSEPAPMKRPEGETDGEKAEWPPEPEAESKTGAANRAVQQALDRTEVDPTDGSDQESQDGFEGAADSESVKRSETEMVSEPDANPEQDDGLMKKQPLETQEEGVPAEPRKETAEPVKPKSSEATGAGAKVLTSTLRAAAPPFEAPPKRVTPPAVDSHHTRTVSNDRLLDRGATSNASFDGLPRSRGGQRPNSTSLTSSPVKKWASTTETPVAAASDLAMAVQKMVGREKVTGKDAVGVEPREQIPGRDGTGGETRSELGRGSETGPEGPVRRPRAMPSEAAQRLGLQFAVAAPESSHRRNDERVRSMGPDARAIGRPAKKESLVDESASWADIEMDNETSPPRRGGSAHRREGWQPPPRGTSSEGFSRYLDRPLNMGALFDPQMRDANYERGLRNQYLERNGGFLDAGPTRHPGQLLDPRSAELLGRAELERLSRQRVGLERWGHDDRASERLDPRRQSMSTQDDLMYGSRVGTDRREGGVMSGAGWFGRRDGQREVRGERLVTHPKAEALREAGGW